MAEGDSRSDSSREEAHGHIQREPSLMKRFRRLLAPLGLLEPDADDVYVPPQKPKVRDPLEETPEEEEREFEIEKMRGTADSDTER